uniref:R domain-containing protein n=1 Tax=Angiostrongylus cantonensis TaxID=6313 RepID=A0A0K0DIJ7_ANGCA
MSESAEHENEKSNRGQKPKLNTLAVPTKQTPHRRRTRREKRRRGGRTGCNESANAAEKSYYHPVGAERIPKRTLAAELNKERRRRENEYLRNNSAGGLEDWPMPDLRFGTLIESDERNNGSSRLWPPTPVGSRTSLSTHWNDQHDIVCSSSEAPTTYDPMSMGLSLGTTVAPVDHAAPFRIFAGADFSLWSTAPTTVDSLNSWSNADEKSSSNEEKR